MINPALTTLITGARRHGYAKGSLTGTFALAGHTMRREAKEAGFEAVLNREGDPIESELTPTPAEKARPASLSAMVGLGAQPLHTDGAHLKEPPDFVVLWSKEPNATSTRVWVPLNTVTRSMRHGMFVVNTGRDTFFAPAIRSHFALRYDPGCMEPVDAAGRDLANLLQNPPDESVTEILWDTPGQVVVIDNRRSLHGRAAVADGDSARVLHRLALRKVTR